MLKVMYKVLFNSYIQSLIGHADVFKAVNSILVHNSHFVRWHVDDEPRLDLKETK